MNIANHRYQINRMPACIAGSWMKYGRDIRTTETIGGRFSAGLARRGDHVSSLWVGDSCATRPDHMVGLPMRTLYSRGEPIAYMTLDGLRMYVCNHHTFSFGAATSAHISNVHTYKNGWRASGRAIWQRPRNALFGTRKIEFTEYVRTAADRDAAMAEHAATYGFTRKAHR